MTESSARHWSFTYTGPVAATDERLCVQCASVAAKKCVRLGGQSPHGTPEAGCPSCQSAASGHCPTHCGVHAAFDAAPVPAELADGVDAYRALLQRRIAAASPTARVEVRAHIGAGDTEYPDADHFSLTWLHDRR